MNDDVRKHLEFVQQAISRMASNSFLIKGWAVTIVGAILAFTAEKDKSTAGAWIGLFPALMFWGLDAYYLRQERLFRKLYDSVRKLSTGEYSMDTSAFSNEVDGWLKTAKSKTVMPLYVALVAVVFAVVMFGPKQTNVAAPAIEKAATQNVLGSTSSFGTEEIAKPFGVRQTFLDTAFGTTRAGSAFTQLSDYAAKRAES